MSVLTPKPNTTIAFTDGACKGNPGPGGWGAFLVMSDGQQIEHFGGDAHTTNNQMELMGAIVALEKSPHDQKLEIWTDSSYVKNGITQWIDNWKKKGWKTSANKPVKNQQLWQRLDALQQDRDVSWHWVKGHAGHEGNERADELANRGILSSSETLPSSDTLTSSDALPYSEAENEQPSAAKKKLNSSNPPDDADWLLDDPLGFNDDFIDADLVDADIEETDALDETSPLNIADDMVDFNDIHDNTSAMNQNTNNQDTPVFENNVPPLETVGAEVDNAHSQFASGMSNEVVEKVEFDGDTSRANPHFKPLLPDPIHRGESGRQLIMDTETTGLDALKGDRIIEVGIIELVDRKFTGEKLHVYINPQRGMDEEVIRVHGISEAFLADKPTFDKVAQKLYDFMLGAEVIAHNAPFDISFLSMEFDKVGLTDFAEKIRVTDSLVLAKQQYPGQKNTLDALVRRLNVGKMDRTFHGALLDSEILAEVYLAMTGGQVALAIDEDIQTKGAGSHADFSHLADKLLTATANFSAHLSWVAKLIKKHPDLAKTQGVTCFYHVTDTQTVPNLLLQKPAFGQHQAANTLANYLYLAS